LLQYKNLDKLIFVSQNWPNDFTVGCNMPSTLLEFIKKDVMLEEELEEREEVVDMNFFCQNKLFPIIHYDYKKRNKKKTQNKSN
jgi:hypothetical protein